MRKLNIFPSIQPKKERQRVINVPIGRILPNPAQSRRTFSDLTRLSESIKRYGVLQPLTVRRVSGGENERGRGRAEAQVYELISGERRLRAAKIAGLSEIPCIAVELNDRQAAERSAAENSNKSPLTFFEEAASMAAFLDVYGLTQEETAAVFGIPKSALSGKLRLLRLTAAEKLIILGGGLTERHAKALLKICDSEKRINVIQETVRLGLSISQTEELVDSVLCPTEERSKKRRVAIKDPRVVYNTIDKAIESIENAGISVEKERREIGDSVELVFRIKKSSRDIPQKLPEFSPPPNVLTNPEAV